MIAGTLRLLFPSLLATGLATGVATGALGCAHEASTVTRAPTHPPSAANAGAASLPSIQAIEPTLGPADDRAARLLAEATRELQAAKTTSYQHVTHVDEAEGIFEFDCSGFVTYALQLADPDALAMVPVGSKGRQRAEDYVAFFGALDDSSNEAWAPVTKAQDLRPGDVIAWLRADDVETKNTGHVVIVALAPTCRDGECIVRVIDSTASPHADDARALAKETGLGVGSIGLLIDESGAPVGYRWKGGVSARSHATTIALARLR